MAGTIASVRLCWISFIWILRSFEARHTGPNDAWERDLITAKKYLDATVFYEPRDFLHREFLDAIFAQSKLLPDGGLGILQELASIP